jgi:hypothetical protein
MCFTSKPHMVIMSLVALLLLGSMSSRSQAGKNGITGVVVQVGRPGPSRPDDPPQYYKGPLAVMRCVDQHLVGTTTSDENGKFTIALAPGEYFITQTDPRYSRIHSDPITVENGKFTSVTIYADNGMR